MDHDNHRFSQSNLYFTDYSTSHTSFVPIVDGSNHVKRIVRCRKELWVDGSRGPYYQRVTIDSLPDDALLEIFKLYVDNPNDSFKVYFDGWHTLVHVCRRWRNVVFSSPRRLNLRLLCKPGRPVREMVDIWPELPITVVDHGESTVDRVENLIAALNLNHRVSEIDLWDVPNRTLERFVAVMQVPFPALTRLEIWSESNASDPDPDLSHEFLGGSAPRLRHLDLRGIPVPALPRLILSATHLVRLDLYDIPHSGYISPDEMVACLSALTRLGHLYLRFRSPLSRPSRSTQYLRPPIPVLLPALIYLRFHGVTEYLEDFMPRIDVPLLRMVDITFFNQLVFDIVQLPKFLDRIHRFAMVDSARVVLGSNVIIVTLSTQSQTAGTTWFKFGVSCTKLDWQLSSLSQLCASTLSTLPNLEHLDIREGFGPDWQDDMENIQWLELLHPFSTVKSLYLSEQVVTRVAPALQELVGERVTDALPTLQVLFLDVLESSGPVQDALQDFVAAHQHSGCPVAIRRQE